jgi:retron-type reverse transcriptase
MKRYNGLFEKIVSLDNIILAHSNARKGKTNRSDVKKVDNDVIGYCTKIQEMLVNETYRTSDYFLFKIYEPKERVIYRLPYYPDRIIHHAIMNILEPIWVGLMIPNTYSCIKNRGIHKVLQDVQRDLHRDPKGTKYCLKLDIKKFYPTIDHDILKQIIRRKIKDVRLLRLLDHIIDSADGVPIGNYLSQFFANLYLNYFDHYIQEQLGFKYYYRYADDIVILFDDK